MFSFLIVLSSAFVFSVHGMESRNKTSYITNHHRNKIPDLSSFSFFTTESDAPESPAKVESVFQKSSDADAERVTNFLKFNNWTKCIEALRTTIGEKLLPDCLKEIPEKSAEKIKELSDLRVVQNAVDTIITDQERRSKDIATCFWLIKWAFIVCGTYELIIAVLFGWFLHELDCSWLYKPLAITGGVALVCLISIALLYLPGGDWSGLQMSIVILGVVGAAVVWGVYGYAAEESQANVE